MSSRRIAAFLMFCAAPMLVGGLGPRTNFDERVLAAHNRERSDADLPLLEWDEELAERASDWARHLAATGRFEHSPDDPEEDYEGENLWGGTAGYYQPESMVGLWIAEKRAFRRGIFPFNSATGRVEDVSHYTQIMWRRTGKVGCALGQGEDEEILVCRYSQAGNVVGELPF